MSIIHINGSSKPKWHNQPAHSKDSRNTENRHSSQEQHANREGDWEQCVSSERSTTAGLRVCVRVCVVCVCVCVCVVFRSSWAQLPNKHTPSLQPPAEFLSGSELNHRRAHAATTPKTSILETRAPPDYSSCILKALPIVVKWLINVERPHRRTRRSFFRIAMLFSEALSKVTAPKGVEKQAPHSVQHVAWAAARL